MGSMVRVLALALALAVPTASAFARPVVVVRPPVVHVGVGEIHLGFDGWHRDATPVHRHGYVWVQGHYDRAGFWVPGHYRPVTSRPGFVWEAGHWRGTVYVDGFWRPAHRAGWHWVPGHYNPHRGWIDGHWSR
jgi:hypothetical protein